MVLLSPAEIMTSLRENKFLSRKKILWTTTQLSYLKCLGIHAVFLLMFCQSTRVVVKILLMDMLLIPEAKITDLLFQIKNLDF